METLRILPAVSGLRRYASVDCQIGKYFIPKGTINTLVSLCTNQYEDSFEDAKDFVPERYMKDSK